MAFSPYNSSQTFFPLLLTLFIIIPPHHTHKTAPKISALSLRTQTLQYSSPTPHPPNKLRFHRNVTLTLTLSVGTPPQNVTMVLDTGSELSWLPLSNFHPNFSSSYKTIPCSAPSCKSQICNQTTHTCHVSLSYADASTAEGTLSSDLFLFGGPPARRTIFGSMSSTFSSSAGDLTAVGMLGMNRGALSFVAQTNTTRFSYCISDRDAGLLLLGEADFVALNYTPLVRIALPLPYFDRVAYSVQLESIRVGVQTLPIVKSVLLPDHTGAGQTMLDSGTQFSFLLGEVYGILKDEFLRQTKGVLTVEEGYVFQGAFDTCFRATDVTAAIAARRIPPVVLGFEGAEVVVDGERLLYRVEEERRGNDEGVWCFTFGNSDLVPIEAYVIGHHHQQNVWVEYDIQNSRVGFAPIQCDLASRRLGLVL